MELDHFISVFQQHPGLLKTLGLIEKEKYISWKGLKGSAFSVLSLFLCAESQKKGIVVFENKEDAAQAFNDMEFFSKKIKVLFLPSAFKRSIANGQPDAESSLLRTEALKHFYQDSKNETILVTYPEALAEKVFNPREIEENTLHIKKDEVLSPEFVADVLQTYGFEFADFVYEPGQYAIRGSIVDVFSYAADYPYRIDFFGETIETIRRFDTETQLSKGDESEVVIIPDLNDETLIDNRISFFDILDWETIFIVQDQDYTRDKISQIIRTATQNSENLKKEFNIHTDTALIPADYSFPEKSIIIYGKPYGEADAKSVEFDTSPQPSFQKNFNLLADNLAQNTAIGYKNLVISEQQKQIDRLFHIFQEINNEVEFEPIIGRLHQGFIDHDLKVVCYTDHQIFERYQRFHLKQRFGKKDAISLAELTGLHPGDYVVHIDHGVGKFGGLHKMDIDGKPQEVIRLIYKDNDVLFVNIHSLHRISKYKGKEGEPPRVHKLGSPAWAKLKQKTKSRVKDIARDLIRLYSERRQQKGFSFSGDSFLNEQLEASFIYEDTPDQEKATNNIKSDMENTIPMDRLVCGDVGFGKTEVAIRAAFKAACDNKQVAVLVPTTILAFQHYKTFTSRLKDFPVKVEYISRMRTAKDQKDIVKGIESGEVNIIIGTHRLVGKDIKFNDLGLLIVDEEQKFGVATKEKIRAMKTNVDTLTLTATPIPRTLQFSLLGARDLSVINTPPPNRHPVNTEIHQFNESIIKEAIDYEVSRGGQVFFIHNRIQNIAEVEALVQRLCPDVRTVHAHGRLEGAKLEKIMLDFIDEKYDVLVATTIIESGLDIPNANTMIINDAQNYGLSDLHQLRGRVGRSNKKAFCYLLTPPPSTITPEARRRLNAIEMFSDLGSGFNISMQDLDIRGAGNMLGAEQSGFIADVGLEAYQQILDEAMHELKEDEFYELFADVDKARQEETKDWTTDCQIETDFEVRLPEYYVKNVSERIKLYRELDNMTFESEIEKFEIKLRDRFGELPPQAYDLLDIVRLRIFAKKGGVEKIVVKKGKMIVYFISKKDHPFYESAKFMEILQILQENPQLGQIQERNDKLRIVLINVNNVGKALEKIKKFV